jgi:hypothetical protein
VSQQKPHARHESFRPKTEANAMSPTPSTYADVRYDEHAPYADPALEYPERPHAAPPEASPATGGIGEAMRAIETHIAELTRAREALKARVRELEAQQAQAAAEASALRAERDHLARLKTLFERKFASIRDVMQQ